MKQADKRNIQNKATNKTNLYITKHAMIHLKHYNGSIIVRKIVLCVCVYVCVTNTAKTTERVK